jgi:hypothetical protein
MSPPVPKPPKVPVLPDPQSPQVLEAQKQAQANIYARTGRRSTILSSQ